MLRPQRHNHDLRSRSGLLPLLCLLGIVGMVSCAAPPSLVETQRVGPLPPDSARNPTYGELVVYSARSSATVGQSEYPLHTDYVLRGSGAAAVRKVSNQGGLFARDPARVQLLPGDYQVKALVEGGGYVVVPVTIEPGRRTVVDLDGTVMPQKPGSDPRWVKLADGQVVGWQARDELDTDSSRSH